jgi:hypothetical protein
MVDRPDMILLVKERNLGWNLLSIKEWLQLARLTCVTCPRTQPYIGIPALPGVMRYNKNRLKKYINESIFS